MLAHSNFANIPRSPPDLLQSLLQGRATGGGDAHLPNVLHGWRVKRSSATLKFATKDSKNTLYYGATLWSYIMEIYHGAVLWSYIIELYY